MPSTDQQIRPDKGAAGGFWRRLRRPSPGVLVVGAVVLITALVVLWSTFSYRHAVHSVHSDIKSVEFGGAEVIDQRIDTCWNGAAPASVTVIRPIGTTGAVEIVAELRAGFESLGYVSEAPTAYTRPQRWTRERTDALDFDIIELTYLPASSDLQIVGDVYDVDMVFCPPF